MQPLIRLISAGHIEAGSIAGANFLGEQKRSVCCTQQSGGTGDHIELIVCLLFSGMMDKEQADAIVIRQRFQTGDDLIVVSITVIVSADFTHLLKRVDNDKRSVWMLP